MVEGMKLSLELLHSRFEVLYILANSEVVKNELLANEQIEIKILSDAQFKKISSLETSPGMALVLKMPSVSKNLEEQSESSIYLDGIRDPGNLGTIVRIADWYGMKRIYCSSDTVDVFNPKCLQSSMGSIGRVEVIYADFSSLKAICSLPFLALTLEGSILHKTKLPEKAILVTGSESHGISEGILNQITEKITIERHGLTESLNAAVATAIACDRLINR